MDPEQPINTPTPISIDTPTENPPFLKTKKGRIIIAGIALFVLTTLSIALFFLLTPKPQKNTPPVKTTKSASPKAKTYPQFEFTYILPEQTIEVPKTLNTYSLKSSFTVSEIASFGAQFGFANPETKGSVTSFANLNDPDSRGYLVLDTKTGTFEYQNLGIKTKTKNTNPKLGAKQFLTDVGLNDTLIDCDITYNDKLIPNVTFVECHRSWEKLGAPLLNLPGVLNIPEDVSLASLRVGYNNAPIVRPSIINVSTGQNGVSRPNDFNTATFAIHNDGTILSISSNLRFITSQSEGGIVSPTNALTLLTQNKAATTIALPSGAGSFDWDRVFPEGKVTGKDAEINGYEIMYVENDKGQSQDLYIPTYLFRGNVMLDSGYNVNYVQTIPATTNSPSSQIASEQLKLGTFNLPTKTPGTNPTNTPTSTRTPTINPTNKPTSTKTPTPTTRITTPYDCSIYSNNDGTNKLGDKISTTVYTITINGVNVNVASGGVTGGSNTFYIAQNILAADVEKYRKGFNRVIAEQYAYNAKHGIDPSVPDNTYASMAGSVYPEVFAIYNTLLSNPGTLPSTPPLPGIDGMVFYMNPYAAVSPCYLTGTSPTIFLYSKDNRAFQIKPSNTIYTDPYLSNFAWNTQTQNDNKLIVNNVVRDFLYYEFNPEKVSFSKQNTGFVVKKLEISSLITKLSQKMNLLDPERKRLDFELRNAISKLAKNTKIIKVSLVSINELNTKLPLTVSPKPENTNRYHFLVEKLSTLEKINEPSIPEVKRGQSTLLEIGASEVQ